MPKARPSVGQTGWAKSWNGEGPLSCVGQTGHLDVVLNLELEPQLYIDIYPPTLSLKVLLGV